jgi:hypothetical protein
MKLNARQVETAKPKDKTYKMADGGGLYLEVSAKGSKYWRMKYRRPSDKKEDRLAFGVWPTVTLAQARAKREAKKLLVQGIDPKAEQKEAQAENSGAYTFETIAREWHASNKRWSEDHRSRVLRYLELYIFPHIGSSDIRQLKTSHLLAPIKKVDASGKHDVAQRLQQRVTALCVMQYRTITSTQIQPVIWPVRYRQPKRDIIRLYLLAGSLSFLHVLLHIVAV